MQTVWDSNLRAMAMLELISKNYQSLPKLAYGFGQDISCIKFLEVCDSRHYSNDARDGDILTGSFLISFRWGVIVGGRLTLRFMEKNILSSLFL